MLTDLSNPQLSHMLTFLLIFYTIKVVPQILELFQIAVILSKGAATESFYLKSQTSVDSDLNNPFLYVLMSFHSPNIYAYCPPKGKMDWWTHRVPFGTCVLHE